MSNAEKIRKMTDEELAMIIENIVDSNCSGCPGQSRCPIDPRYEDRVGCNKRILDWLKDEEDNPGILYLRN